MAEQKKYIVVELRTRGGTKEVEKSITRVVTDLKAQETRLKEINKQYKDQKMLVDDLKRMQKTAKAAGAPFDSTQLRAAQRELNKLNREFKQTSVNLAANKKAFNTYKNELVKGAGEAKKGFWDLTRSSDQQGESLQSLAVKVVSLAVAYRMIKQALGFLVRSHVEFEYTLMNVQTLLNNIDRSLKGGAIQVMRDYGFSVQDVNKALFDAISAMIPVNSAIDFLNEASRLAVGGVTTLKVAVDGLTSVINAYGLNVSEAGRVADAFFRAQKWGKTTVQDLVENIGRLAPVASIAGVSYQEMLSALSELTLVGLDTRESVTVLRQAIAGVIKPAAHAEEALRKYNVPVGVAEVSAAGLAYTLERLMAAYEEFPDIISEMIPNIRAFTGVTALNEERLKHLRMVTRDVMENWGEFSSLTNAFIKQMDTSQIKINRFNAELKAVGIQLGEKLKRPLEWAMRNFRLLGTSLISLVIWFGTFTTIVVGLPPLLAKLAVMIQAVRAGVTSMVSAITVFGAAAATALGVFAAMLTSSATKVKGYVATLGNLSEQIKETRGGLDLLSKRLKAVNERLSKLSPDADEYNSLIKQKSLLLNEINTTYGEYLSNLLSEKMSNDDITTAITEANKAIEENIALKMRQKAITEIQQEYSEDLKSIYNDIDRAMLNAEESNRQQITAFMVVMETIIADANQELIDLVSSGESSLETINALREKLFDNVMQEFISFMGDSLPDIGEYLSFFDKGVKKLLSPDDIQRSKQLAFNIKEAGGNIGNIIKLMKTVSDLTDRTFDYGEALGVVNLQLEAYREAFERARMDQQEFVREFEPAELWTERTIGFKGGKKKSYWEFRNEMLGLEGGEYEQWKGQLMQELLDLYDEMAKLMATGFSKEFGKPYAEMSQIERATDSVLTSYDIKIQAKLGEIANAIEDWQKEQIKSWNFYMKATLDNSKALTDQQVKNLGIAIQKWHQKWRKHVNDHNKFMLNMHLQYIEDEINAYETGYTKELLLLDVGYAKKIAQLQVNYEKEKEARIAFLEEMQITATSNAAEFNKQMLDLEKQNNNKVLQEYQHYQVKRRDIANRIIEDTIAFRMKYVHEGDKLIQLEDSLRKTFVSMVQSFKSLNVDAKLLSVSFDELSLSTENINEIIGDFFLKFSASSTTNIYKFVADMVALGDALIEFNRKAEYLRAETRHGILESLGIATWEDQKMMESMKLVKEYQDNRQGLIDIYIKEAVAKKGGIALTEEETQAINDQVDALRDLAEEAQKVRQDRKELDLQRETGNATYGKIYDQEVRELEMKLEFKQITQEDFDNAVAILDKEIPKWTRKYTESAYEEMITIADRSLAIISNTINQAFQMRAENSNREHQREMEKLTDRHNTELDLLKNRLDKGLVSEERYKKEKEKIDEKYRRREDEMKRRQFENDKKRAIAQVIIQGAIAAIRAYADTGILGGILGSVLVAAETAAQVAIIASQKYKKGGIIGGKPHSQGGTRFVGSDGSVFEAEKDELMLVINKQSTALLSALGGINSIYGKKFGKGGVAYDGGRFARETERNVSGLFDYNSMVSALEKMPPPVVYVDEIERKVNRVARIRDAAK